MNKDIHPKYQQVAFHDTSVDSYIVVGSTLQTDKTVELNGKVYPYFAIEVSSKSHPFYTGKESIATQDGRVAKFNNRFGSIKS
ncbi:50S ribosomal protein L31 [Psychromonas sp. psych-6C06]|uniref:type B 50S ribosomal protein L31 n=1 Tax=Psychromonas sp. psych-6C06 TaxID=2058089 RepID=UPI000C32DB2B|nr:type B 50S ribosomal protein L31 [Psychromonas sp. psych-6C06]PKF61541.1 50S ribosomal protein L31 [Psychromonas sp. psych-6C06]